MNDKTARTYWDYRAAEVEDEHELVYNDALHYAGCEQVMVTLLKQFVKKGDRVLDIGCGFGRFSLFVRDQGAEYTGVDFSKEMLKRAERRFPGQRFLNIDIRKEVIPDEYEVVFECICASSIDYSILHAVMEEACTENGLCIMVEANEVRVWSPGGRNLFA